MIVRQQVSILPARRDDLPAVMSLERAGFPRGEQWSERSWLGELLGDGRTVLIARSHVPVGVISLQTVGDLADLHRIVVSEQHRREGIGAALVDAVRNSDFPVVQALSMIIASVYIVVNLIADIASILLTPRARTGMAA